MRPKENNARQRPSPDPNWNGTAYAEAARLLLFYGMSRDIPMAELMERFALTPEMLVPLGRVPLATLKRMWEGIEDVCDDPDLPVTLRRMVMGADVDPPLLYHLYLNSPTLRDAVGYSVRYERLAYDNAEANVEFRERDGTAEIVVHPDRGAFVPPPSAVAFELTGFATTAPLMIGRPVPFCEVRLRHRRPRDMFGVEPIFEAPVDRLRFDAACLDTPNVRASTTISAVLLKHADAAVQTLPARSPFARSLREAVRDLLPEQGATLSRLARRLGLSERTLQRRAEAEGQSLREVIDDVRRELALAYVTSPGMTLVDVAFAVGFSDQASFTRAFLRWTGTPPGRYRSRGGR